MNITLYTQGCPKCLILEKKLNNKNISYKKNENIKEMLNLGLKDVPWLEVNGELMNFEQANKWINEQ